VWLERRNAHPNERYNQNRQKIASVGDGRWAELSGHSSLGAQFSRDRGAGRFETSPFFGISSIFASIFRVCGVQRVSKLFHFPYFDMKFILSSFDVANEYALILSGSRFAAAIAGFG
jgi:hypothetical protein